MPTRKTINWFEIDKAIAGLETDMDHQIYVQREAIPLVFVPGIMGSCLRRSGTDGTGFTDGLPDMRWNPSSTRWMLKHMSGTSAASRKAMLVGDRFDPAYLEPADTNPPADGFPGLMADYCKHFLRPLREHNWGALNKIFEFPVFAVGYNWTDSAENAGIKLAARIEEIIAEARKVVGLCEKVIVITHSMGGLVSRSASEITGAKSSILGIVHAVQPATGSPAGYWRVKAGFEGSWVSGRITSRVLGNSGERVTPLLGNIPGGLQLLPNKLHRTNNGAVEWLAVTEGGKVTRLLPESDPYEEIYRVKAVVHHTPGEAPGSNSYWGLIDPNLLNPGFVPPQNPNARDQMDADALSADPWPAYLTMLRRAEIFHDTLGKRTHKETFCLHGTGHDTADVIELRIESNWVRSDPYPVRGFRGFFADAEGNSMQAVLRPPEGVGDGTVVRSSAKSLDAPGKPKPGDRGVPVAHQPAYEHRRVQSFAIEAIVALCKKHYESRR